MKRSWKRGASAAAAALMAIAPALDMAVQRKALPDAVNLLDGLYQLVARTFAAVNMDGLTLSLLFAACMWLCRRYLFAKSGASGVGEYFLCAFLSLMMLLYHAVRTGDSLSLLWQNPFQIVKAALYMAGMYLLCLMLLRALEELLNRRQETTSPSGRVGRWFGRMPFWASFTTLCLCWLPHLIIRYPGVLMWDSYAQIKQYIGEATRIATHPPFGTLVYGLVYQAGRLMGSVNIAYFIFTLLQSGCFIAVLAYSLLVMRRCGVPRRVRVLAMALYALSPCYVGWATVIGKDSAYLLLCMLLCTLLLELSRDPKRFLASWGRMAGLAGVLTLMMLTRHNGALVAGALLIALAILLVCRRLGHGAWLRLIACAAVCALLTLGVEGAITRALHIQQVYLHDTLSLPFQQTARVVKLHGDELPAQEREIIDRVLAYDVLAEKYEPDYADAVKDTYRQSATAADRTAYLRLWAAHLVRYPVDSLDALLHMNGVLFSPQYNYPVYISLSDNALTDYVYPMSFNDMKLYEREALTPLNSAQRLLTQCYYDFDQLPVIGLFANMGFCVDGMLMLIYLSFTRHRRRGLWVWLPALVTAVGCLLSPVVYLRYALPVVCALPLGLGAYYLRDMSEGQGR